MKLLIVTLCILAALVPAALSIECYVCSNSNGNCETGKTTCPVGSDRCGKVKSGDKIEKTCGTSVGCTLAKSICDNSGKCEAYCCDSDLCNGGVPLKPVTFLTLFTIALGVAKYLM